MLRYSSPFVFKIACLVAEVFEKVKKYEFAKKKSSKTSENICLDVAVITSER